MAQVGTRPDITTDVLQVRRSWEGEMVSGNGAVTVRTSSPWTVPTSKYSAPVSARVVIEGLSVSTIQ